MYTIISRKDGRYDCQGRLQDGTEYWTEDSLDAAIKSMIQFARIMNGSKITKKHITFLRPVRTIETKYEEFRP